MEARDKNTYRMLTTVQSTYEANKTLKAITNIPALVKAHNDLAAVNAEIASELEETVTPPGPSPATSVKTALFTEAVESCAELAGAVHSYAVDNQDADLATRSNYSETNLRKGREPIIVAKCTKVVTVATEVADDLDDYGYTAQDVVNVGKSVEAFAKSCPKPRQTISKRSASNQALPKLLRKARRIVTSRIDKLTLQLRKTAPAFYAEYKAARKVVAKPGSQSDNSAKGSADSVPTALSKAA
jgi:hypothetical protein